MSVEKLKEQMKAKKIPYWRVAAKLGVHENTIARLLRTDLPREKQKAIQDAIREIEQEAKP